ncbi:Protein LNK2 [Bienertia sinuspersici]
MLSKHEQETERITDFRLMRDVYDTWPSPAASVPQFGHQCAQATATNYSGSISGQQQLSQDFRPVPYQNCPAPYVAPYAYGNFINQYPAMRMLKPMKDDHLSILSGPEAKPGDIILNKPVDVAQKPAKMTPQEKIEKLRRRQQMRAMLAIQKQQQRLGHQASSGDYSHTHKSLQEDQIQLMEKSDLEADEHLSILPCYDPGSPKKGDDSSTISNINDYALEDTVLYQLQDIVSRLDMKIRLCIRDSLYRLAHSATQRHYASNTNSNKRSSSYDPDIAKEETSNHDRFVGNANVETETNHIDRAVAHLLFHRPLKLSVRHAETPESSTSTKVSTEQETATPSSLSVGMFARSSESEYNLSPHRSKSPRAFLDSQDEDTLNDVSRKEMKISPQMKQMTTEHAGQLGLCKAHVMEVTEFPCCRLRHLS